MSELRLRERAAAWLAGGVEAVVVEVVEARGSVPRGVGTRPADVCGLDTNPISSRSAMMLRMVAGDRSSPDILDRAREPTGWPSAIYRSTRAFNRVCARLSSCIVITLMFHSSRCSHYAPSQRLLQFK